MCFLYVFMVEKGIRKKVHWVAAQHTTISEQLTDKKRNLDHIIIHPRQQH